MIMIETHLANWNCHSRGMNGRLHCMNAAFFFFFSMDELKWRHAKWMPVCNRTVAIQICCGFAKRCKMLQIFSIQAWNKLQSIQIAYNLCVPACNSHFPLFFFVSIMKCKQLFDINFQIRFHSIRLQNRDFYLSRCNVFFLEFTNGKRAYRCFYQNCNTGLCLSDCAVNSKAQNNDFHSFFFCRIKDYDLYKLIKKTLEFDLERRWFA